MRSKQAPIHSGYGEQTTAREALGNLDLSGAMAIVSYAQNFEDVMLARAFPGAEGFYVDVGANDPDIDSVTRVFYERCHANEALRGQVVVEADAELHRDRPLIVLPSVRYHPAA